MVWDLLLGKNVFLVSCVLTLIANMLMLTISRCAGCFVVARCRLNGNDSFVGNLLGVICVRGGNNT